MECLNRFNRRMKLSGGSLRNENIKNSIDLLRNTFYDDASFRPGIYYWERGLESYDDKKTVDVRIFNRTFSNAVGVQMEFQTLIDLPIVVGDVLYDYASGEYLLCTESFNINDIHWQGKLTLCNWILKWQDKNGNILEYPCQNMNTTQYNSGERSNKIFTIGSSQHAIMLPYDENTVSLNCHQRFFLDRDTINPTSYRVTQNDTITHNYGKKGIVKITVTECANNHATDRIDLGICDYIDKNNVSVGSSDDKFISKSVISYDTTVIKSGGDSQVFIGTFFDDNGNMISGIVPKWEVVCDFKDALHIEERGNQMMIWIDNDEYVDEEFKLILSNSSNDYQSSLIIRVESLL